MVGVKTYFPENTPEFSHFRKRFRQKFDSNYPEEEQDEPGIFAVQGYNAVKLLQKYLTENIQEWKPIHEPTVEIVSVIGKKYNSVYWTEGLGFSDDINGASVYTHSMHNVGRSLWPVQPWYAHRRRRMNQEKTSGKRMKVAVPCTSLFPEFVKCEDSIDGFVIKVFDEMMTKMNQPYDAIPFYGTYDQLMEEVYSEKYDAAAGDVTITEKRQESVIFTQPYTESGLEMIVPVRSGSSNQSWLFLKPFTSGMWRLIVAITIYNGFVIWLIERSHDKNLQGSIITQIGIILWLAFSSLFTLRGDKMHSNLSRMAVVVWLFVALVIIQSYTASLASMLTTPKLEPTITSVDMLKNMNATVGYCNGSSIYDYLKVVLGFEDLKISSYNSTDGYAEALNSREIAAIFLEVPAAKVFLAKYCKSFIRTGETFKVGGFGFAFGSRFSRLLDANKALTNISESRKLKELEDEYLNSGKCVDEEPEENQSLNCHSFWVLFVLTVGTSTIALSIYIIMRIIEFIKFKPKHINLFQLIAFIKVWQRRSRMRRSSTIVPNGEIEIQYTH
ncbi:hypothetical protein L1987_70641 [Smallanthus sonchifolius]|uniref:Uncharacterized protein n=1 Tax=Smallanthus sonchifolius TaxID=185202 RepID=A0ACB9AQF8_9ASTR|nr:hypothetical protein L1987_70641 [Smallanthus sonchifolius]